MATQVQIRRGTSSQVAAFTGAEGEIVVNTTNDSIHVNDGSTAGGFELARADLNNVSDTDLNAALTGNTVSALTVTSLTSSGIDVTGTVTADSAKVENGTTSTVTISESTGSGTAELRFVATESFPKTKIVTDVSAGSLSLETLGNERLNIANNGDISFYEDTGTTPKLFWDASAESLGIGTSSIDFQASNRTVVHIEGSAGALLALEDTGAKSYLFQTGNDLLIENDTASGSMIFGTNASTERMRILSTGGITFNGDTAQANALDDYEEGVWTPVLSGSGYSFGTHTGTYVKVGKVVTVSALLNITAVGSSTSTISLSGYPFVAHTATNQFQLGVVRQTTTSGVLYVCQINVGLTVGGINSMDGVTSGSDKIFTTGNYGLSMTYIANS